MTLGDLAKKLIFYMAKPDDTDFIAQGGYLIVLDAINSARKSAEQQYAFERNKKVFGITVDLVAGTDWTILDTIPDGDTFRVRSIKNAYIASSNPPLYRVDFEYRDALEIPTTPWPDMSFVWPASTEQQFGTAGYPPDWYKLYIIGEKLYRYPGATTGTQDFLLDAYAYMDDYVAADSDALIDSTYTDWMLRTGDQYLFWQALVELNFSAKEYVPRQEGNLPPPDARAEREFQKLVQMDSQLRNGMSTISRHY